MSGRYVSRVLESDLRADLKFTAVVLASFADDHDGTQIRPAIGHLAYLRGLEERQAQYHVKELRDMAILEVFRPATQWNPTHYRMRLEKLPARAPYRPPDRQRSLLGPPPKDSGVQSPAPPPGVQSSAPGVQPTAPDPSVRSVTTRTDPAHAREAAAGDDLPLVGLVTIDRDHIAHAWCGRLCVPKFLHRRFKRALGGPLKFRPQRLRTFYAETLAAIPGTRDIGDEPVRFWNAAFAARFMSAAPAPSRHEGGRFGSCPHEEQCASIPACRDRSLAEARAERERKQG